MAVIDQFANYRERKLLLSQLIGDTSGILQSIDMTSYAEILSALSKKVERDSFKIQIVGTFKNGKSTFINALLCEDILPSKALPCTAVINEVKYGNTKKAILHFVNPLPEKLLSDIPGPTMKHMQKYGMKDIPPMEIDPDNIDAYVTIPVDGDPEEISLMSPYKAVELFYPCPLLKEGVEIIDSPGLNENDERTRVTLEYLDKADAIIFLLDSTHPCAKDEMDMVEGILIPKGFKDIFFVANRFDLIRERERADIKAFLEKNFSKFSSKPIFCLSALDALDGKIENDEGLLQKSGIVPFEACLTDFLTKEKGKIKLVQPAAELNSILSKKVLFNDIPTQLQQLSMNVASLQERYNVALPKLNRLEADKQHLYDGMALQVERSLTDVRRACLNRFNEIARLIPGWIEAYQPKVTLGNNPFTMKKKATAVINEITAHVTEKVKDNFRTWSDEVLVPLMQEKATALFENSNQSVANIFDELDNVVENLTGVKVEYAGANGWERALGAAGIYMGFGATGGSIMTNGFKLGDFIKNIALDLGVFIGLGLLALLNPVAIVGAIILLVVKGLSSGSSKAMAMIKSKTSEAIVAAISNSASDKTQEVINQVRDKMMEIAQSAMSSIDTEISNVKTQVEGVLSDLKKGQAHADSRKRLLNDANSKLQKISEQLTNFVFELAGTK